MKKLFIVTHVLFAALICPPANAATVIVGGAEIETESYFFATHTQGIDFISTAAQQISALGFWDAGADGLASSFSLGLWNTSTKALLASVTIDSNDPLDANLTVEGGQWRYETFGSPVSLDIGAIYTIGFYTSAIIPAPDALLLNYPTVTTSSTVTIIDQRRFLFGDVLSFPENRSATANSFYTAQVNAHFVVPEPGIAGLLAMGMIGFLARRRVRSRSLVIHLGSVR